MTKTPLLRFGALLCGLAMYSQPASAVTFTVYTSRAAWEAAVGAYLEEQFADATLNAGLSFSTTGSGHSTLGISGGAFHDRLIPGSTTTWSFVPDTRGFGANWDLRPGGAGLGLRFTTSAGTVAGEVPHTYSGGFYGFKSDTDLLSVTVLSGSQGGVAETYDMDNLVYTAAVPEGGAGGALLALASLGLATYRLRGKRA